jgi:omega-6 fatty acid desaturase (delta-12 desaturase)
MEIEQTSGAAEAARAWRASLPRERRRSTNLRGVLLFSLSAGLYAALFLAIFWLPSWWMRYACLAAMPFLIGSLFVIGHDGAHYSLTRSGWLNRVIGMLSLLPAYHPYTSRRHAHNTLHHGSTCLKSKHPDFTPLSLEEFDRLPAWRQRLERIYRAPLGVGLCYTLDFFGRYLLFPSARNRPPNVQRFHLDRLLVAAFFGAQLWTGYQLAAHTPQLILSRWLYVTVAVTLPWIIWIYFMGVASFVQHTHPRTAWYDNDAEWAFYHVQLCSTTHMVLPSALGRMLHNIMDHPAHHIDPTIPLYELPASQKMLEDRAPRDSIVVPLSWREYKRICCICKLYDYRRHCWLDFNGRPTTNAGLPQPADA